MEPATQLVVDAATGHALQRGLDHAQRLRLPREQVIAQEELQHHRLGELGRRPESAVFWIVV